MKDSKAGSSFKSIRESLISGLIGAGLFFLFFGAGAVDINGYTLFTRGDPGQHYIGWRFFKASPWLFPPGLMNNIDAPFKVSVIFTDSIPLAAVIFKTLRGILPEKFNYFGLWVLICFILQGVSASILLRILAKAGNRGFYEELIHYISVFFFLITPAFIKRAFWHTALTSHFLILFSLCLLFGRRDYLSGKRQVLGVKLWALMGFLCAGIHLYFLGICGLVALCYGIFGLKEERKVLLPLLSILSFGLTGVATVYLLGGFNSDMASGAPGFGFYSFNLNGFFNGKEWSRFLDFDYYAPGQVEGFSYLGLGVILILIWVLLDLIKCYNDGKLKVSHNFFPGLVLFILSVLIAVSREITFSDRLLFTLNIGEKGIFKSIFEILRSSGRFAWVGMYLLMCAAFSRVASFSGREPSRESFAEPGRISLCLCFIALLVQLMDLDMGLGNKIREVRNGYYVESCLYDEYWNELSETGDYKHLVFMDKGELSEDELYSLSFYALENGLTINDFNFARALENDAYKAAEENASNPSPDTIYVFSKVDPVRARRFNKLKYRIADGMLIGVMK